MRVMITGGTGFVGYHTARALMDAGHEVSLLVRSVDKMLRLYGDDCELRYTRGDIVDADKVRRALEGCDAVIHAAAMVSTKASDAERVYSTNVRGCETVIGSALESGVGSVIHVSSVTALYDPQARVLDEHSPPGAARNAYGRSKVACEHYVRRLQAGGERIYISYPASVIGPADPGLTEPHAGLRGFLSAFVPAMTSGNQWVDVRDVAAVHLRLLERLPPAGNYTVGGHYVPWVELGPLLERLTGRKLLKLRLPAGPMRLAGRMVDKVNKYFPVEMPISEEAMEYATNWVPLDNSKVEEALDFEFRPVEDSMAETITWLYQSGYISKKQAGRLAADQQGGEK